MQRTEGLGGIIVGDVRRRWEVLALEHIRSCDRGVRGGAHGQPAVLRGGGQRQQVGSQRRDFVRRDDGGEVEVARLVGLGTEPLGLGQERRAVDQRQARHRRRAVG